ncbi:hypothetical protein BJV77DRAFT_989611 [Russula vinacea]|nr:hypothetical protein BJV77DRAFT_989611 [Russula vinacea]
MACFLARHASSFFIWWSFPIWVSPAEETPGIGAPLPTTFESAPAVGVPTPLTIFGPFATSWQPRPSFEGLRCRNLRLRWLLSTCWMQW